MEKDNFDEEFKNRIKQVFEDYNDGAADEGWNLLREKYPEKKRRDVFFWWISSAAAVFLIAFIFWFLPSSIHHNNASTIVKLHKTEKDSALLNSYLSTQKPAAVQIITDSINTKKKLVKTVSGFGNRNRSETNRVVQNQVSADTTYTQKTPVKTVSDFVVKNLSETNRVLQNQVSANTAYTKNIPIKTVTDFVSAQKLQRESAINNQNNTSFTGIKIDSAEIKNQQKFTIVPQDSSAQKTLVAVTKKTNLILTKPAVDKFPEAETIKKTTEKSAIFSLEVYAGSHVNYATGSNNQLGLGAGFSTDFRLSKNFKLSTGLGLMQNNLTYGQDIPRGSLNAASVTYSVASAPSGLTATAQTPSLNTMGTRLLALDVPLNLVYNFSPGKNSISISAGISSNTFVKEAYDYHYSNSTNTTQNIKSFNNFNLAKTLNLAAGFAYPLGKNQLQVEPFLKYPLGGSGSQQLQFGSAGINLKMNIQSFKDKHK